MAVVIVIQLLSRFLKCIHGALCSDNCIVSLCAKLTEQSQSIVAKHRQKYCAFWYSP